MQNLPTILLAEDDDGHALLIRNSLRKAGFLNKVVRFRDGQEVLEFLSAEEFRPGDPDGARILMLDIRMPKIDGIEVLRRIRSDAGFDLMPVIIVTTMDDQSEVLRCRQLGCNFYLVKPGNWKLFTEALSGLTGVFTPEALPVES